MINRVNGVPFDSYVIGDELPVDPIGVVVTPREQSGNPLAGKSIYTKIFIRRYTQIDADEVIQ